MKIKEIAQLDADEGLWEDIREILRPVLVREFARAYRMGYVIAVLEMDAIRKSFDEDLVARADALLGQALAAELGTVGATGFVGSDWPDLNAYIEQKYYSPWWSRWSETQRNAVRDVINRANQQALTNSEVVAELRLHFDRKRAETIAATEVTNIVGIANQAAYRQTGFGEWEWRTAADRRVDPTCEALDGNTFPISVLFSAAHPRCRCWPVPVANSLSPVQAETIPAEDWWSQIVDGGTRLDVGSQGAEVQRSV